MAPDGTSEPKRRRTLHPWETLRHQWGRTLKPEPQTHEPDEDVRDTAILTMLRALGVAMLAASQATNDIENTLYEIAARYNLTGIRIAVLPTIIILQLDPIAAPGGPPIAGSVSTETGSRHIVDTAASDAAQNNAAQKNAGQKNAGQKDAGQQNLAHARPGRTEFDTLSTLSVRLDQAAAIDELVHEAQHGTLDPGTALGRLASIRTAPPRYGPWMTVVGHTVLCLGFGLTLNPTVGAIPAYLLLGALVGGFILLGKRLPTVGSALPVFAAFIVTVVTTLFLSTAAGDDPLKLIAPALVSFLPGLTLTVASIELTSNQIIAGASRVVYGVAQLLLLAFGVIAGLTVTHGGTEIVQTQGLGWWSGIAGVALVAIGFVFFLSAPKGSFLWILVALFVAYGAQTLGSVFLGPVLSGFIGALVVVPFSRFLAQFRGAPPATVMMLASFWLLVPGALGFIGISESATGTSVSASAASVATLVNTGLSLFSIALGILVGTGLTRDFTRARVSLKG